MMLGVVGVGGREVENSQEEREWLLGWQDQFTSADGLRYQHQLTDRLIRLYWPNTYIHNMPPPKPSTKKKNHSHMQIKIILTGKEITTDMKVPPDFINKNKYTYYVKGSLSSQLQKTIFLNSTGSSHDVSWHLRPAQIPKDTMIPLWFRKRNEN